MDLAKNIALTLVEPFAAPLLPHTRFYWLYVISALAIAYIVYRRGAWAQSAKLRFIEFVLPKDIYLHPSALVDYRYFVVNHYSFVLLVAPLLLSAPGVAKLTNGALVDALGPSPAWAIGGVAMTIVCTVFVAIAFDIGLFIGHLALHRIPILWEFHKVHHSAEVLTPATVYRVHPVEDLLNGAVTGMTTGLAHGIFAYGVGHGVTTATVLNVDAALFVFYVLGYNLRHSHIWLAYPGWLSRILVSPAQHQIHHSTDPRHLDKNLGFMFAAWDWLCGTLYVPKEQEALRFGLVDADAMRDYRGVIALYLVPFRNLMTRWRSRWLIRA